MQRLTRKTLGGFVDPRGCEGADREPRAARRGGTGMEPRARATGRGTGDRGRGPGSGLVSKAEGT